ncbi:MAG: glycosyltransferase family 2 protein, partial [Candidatus Eremiobacteraeota bacterium]|nr:glycosyltransferase family 2 protein [Candidatus Eremiobacteraeota bacterium]
EVVVSQAASARIAALYAHWHGRRVIPAQRDPLVPSPQGEPGEREHVVVWAPQTPIEELALKLCAVEELHLPVYAVCNEGPLPPGIHRCPLEQAEPVLRGAAAILVADDDGPASAIALAAYGIGLATARTSGALEFLEGIASFDGWNRDSILAAVLQAIGAAAPVPRLPVAGERRTPARNAAFVGERAQLVSIVIPTYNRRRVLPRMLESIARQQYPAIETIVVNDGGEEIGDIASRFEATLVERSENRGHAAASNAGLEVARGEYVAVIDDDDVLFPYHVATLVDVLERSGRDVAHTNSLMMLTEREGAVVGFSPGSLGAIDPNEALVLCPLLGMLSMLMRRSVFAEAGGFDEALTPNDDYEMILRLALRYDVLHVDRTTCLYSYSATSANTSVATGIRYAELYEEAYRRHPQPDRPILAAKRRGFVEAIRRMEGIRLSAVGARLDRPITI